MAVYEQTNADSFIAESDDYYEVSETEKSLNTYFFSIKNFGWINCDRFYDYLRYKVEFTAQFILPTDEKKSLEIHNYIVFDSLMSVIPLYKDSSGLWTGSDLPTGAPVTCISIQKSATHLYYGVKKTIIGNRESSIIE